MKSLDKKKPSYNNSGLINNQPTNSGLKKKTKELELEKEFERRFWDAYQEDELQYSDVKSFISSLLDKQRTELLEEIKTRIDTWGGFEDDGGNLCHYDSEILEWVNNLLNKKDE